MHTSKILLLFALAWSLARAQGAGPGQSALETDPNGWMDIQPSAGLIGWTRITIPPGKTLGRPQWHVESSGKLLVCDGDGGHEMLRYDRECRDCIFHVEFRFVPVTGTNQNYNSGVFIRNSADGATWNQAQLTMDGGYWFGAGPVNGEMKRYHLKPAERRMKPAGEWDTIEVTAHGNTLSAWFNGAVTCTYTDCEQSKGYVASSRRDTRSSSGT